MFIESGVVVVATVGAVFNARKHPFVSVFRDVVFDVLGTGDRTDEQIADDLDVARGQLAAQKNLDPGAHLSAYRIAALPLAVQLKILITYIRQVSTVTIIEDPLLGEFLEEGLREFRHRRMARMTLSDAGQVEDERTVA